jgi:cysteine-rich repeat protein
MARRTSEVRRRWAGRLAVALGLTALGSACGEEDPAGQVPAASEPVIESFAASASSVGAGETVTLTWKVSGATPFTVVLSATPGGTLVGAAMAEGSVQSAPLTGPRTVFTLTARSGRLTVAREVTVTSEASTRALSIETFAATPTRARLGDEVELRWETLGADRVRVLDGPTERFASEEQVERGSVRLPLMRAEQTFTLEASREGVSVSKPVTVTAELPPQLRAFRASPSVFTGASAAVNVAWSARGRTTLTAGGMPVAGFPGTETGTISVTVADSTELVLGVSSAGETLSARRRVVRGIDEREPNDLVANANDLRTAGGARGTFAGEGDVDLYRLAVPPGGSVRAELTDDDGRCEPFAVLTLLDANGVALGRKSGRCPSIDPTVDRFAAELAGGAHFVQVSAFGSGAYGLAVQVSEGGCGNRVLEEGRGEQCDDGNLVAADGCGVSCRLELAGTVDTATSAADARIAVNLGDANASARLIALELTEPGLSIAAETSTGDGCAFPTELALLRRPSQALLGRKRGAGGCARLVPAEDDFAADLAAGRYLLAVRSASGPGGASTVTVRVRRPACGNGIRELSRREECDDGNATGGDGCDAACRVEASGTVEGLGREQTFSGGLRGPRDLAYYRVVLPGPGYIRAETGVPSVGACTAGAGDTVLALTDANLALLGADDDAAGSVCSRIDPRTASFARLPAGTYFVRVSSFAGAASIPAYQVRIRTDAPSCGNGIVDPNEACDDGNTASGDRCSPTCALDVRTFPESEPNDSVATADSSGAIRGGGRVTLAGSLTAGADRDFYSLLVTAGPPVRLEAYTYWNLGDPALECDSARDTVLSLETPTGVRLAVSDDAAGRGFCSALGGMSGLSVSDLAPGPYLLVVRHFAPDATMPVYFLDVSLSN